TWDGVFLQSGSFFTADLDPQESGFEHWRGGNRLLASAHAGRPSAARAAPAFVASVHAASQPAPGAPPVALVCGSAEENYANNLAIRDHLASIGVETSWGELRDGHTWTCWRDTLDPHLTGLLTRVWA